MTTFLKIRDMKFSFHLLLTCIALTACGESGKTTADYRIVPRPGEIAPGDGGDFELDARTRIVCTGDGDGMRANAEFLAGYVESVVGSAPEITGPDGLCDDGRAVILRADAPGKGGEAYEIEVSENRITVSGESDAGVFYGIQTLRKAMGAAKAAKVLFPAVRIADEPYLGYRGVMLDVGRTFYPVEEVKRIIDLAALHNLNVFHWHLTDDQGWRIEIDAYPRLTETGAFRRDTPQEWPRSMYYRYWTQHEIRPAHMGIRNDRYKLIFFYGDRLGMTGSDDCVSTPSWEFYDLRTDPHENRNQYGNPAYAEVIGAMKREMLELRRQYKDTDEGSARMREIMETHYAPESAKH